MFLENWIKEKLKEYNIYYFYYFSHIKNIDKIIRYGILSYKKAKEIDPHHKDIANSGVQRKRVEKNILFSDKIKRFLHDAVPVYLTSKTPALYVHRDIQDEIFFILINSFIISDHNSIKYAFTDGNAASTETRHYYSLNKLNEISWDVIKSPYWNDFPDGKRKRSAEFLIYPGIPISEVWYFCVSNEKMKKVIEKKLKRNRVEKEVRIDKEMFF